MVDEIERLKKHGGNIRQLALEHGLAKKDIVDFSSNINPYGPPESVLETIKNAIDSVSEYPEQQAESLVAEISSRLGISTENVVAGNGTIEFIHILPQIFEPQKAILPVPSFTEYELALKKSGATIDYKKSFSRKETLLALDEAADADIVFLGNPNNPCGYMIKKGDLLRAIDENTDCLWVIDEAFIDFTQNCADESLVREAVRRKNLIVLRSLTKIYSIPGLRVGYAVAGKDVTAKIRDAKYPWSVNSIAISAGVAALRDSEFVRESVSKLMKEAKRFYAALSNIEGLFAFEPDANFILVRIEKNLSAAKLQEMLLYRGFAIRDCSTYTGICENYFRVAVKHPENNERLINALKDILR
ncbi:MAG: threonine-phosphate decarboxylase CobD [Firmicutes bacterium]|nr:threonine-phosphate decarboxylase CobD [Bacillota bacterium]